jgi:hypothetical protein
MCRSNPQQVDTHQSVSQSFVNQLFLTQSKDPAIQKAFATACSECLPLFVKQAWAEWNSRQ